MEVTPDQERKTELIGFEWFVLLLDYCIEQVIFDDKTFAVKSNLTEPNSGPVLGK